MNPKHGKSFESQDGHDATCSCHGEKRRPAQISDKNDERRPLDPVDSSEGYRRAVEILHDCSSREGFLASPIERANYRKVWSRDGVIIGLAALLTDDEELIHTFKRTLEFLSAHQGPQGEIPSNADGVTGRVSYGGTTGRVDADLWFIIGCGEFWRATGDDEFLRQMLPILDRAFFLLRAWEFNNRGLLYVPPAGDWADEYIQSGYVLYDQLLYLQAQRTMRALRCHLKKSPMEELEDRIERLERLLKANYWFAGVEAKPEDVYHFNLYRKGRDAPRCRCRYWMPFFSPHGYGYRFDSFANVLASLLDVAQDSQRERVDHFIEELVQGSSRLLPAFHPVIKPVDDDWEDLQINFSYSFRNEPYEYQNGGLWPMITGFYVADLARRGQKAKAQDFLNGIHAANALELNGTKWSFPEYLDGRDLTAGGTSPQGWSAAAAVMGHHALQGKEVFRISHTSPGTTRADQKRKAE